MDIKVTPVFESIWDNDSRITVLQGGTRSSKTYSIVQYLILKALESPKKITIVRKAQTTINKTVGEDFLEIMREWGYYKKEEHNRSDNIYRFPNGSVIDFLGCDDPQKLRGNKRDILYCNEANELTWEDFFQLLMRTKGEIYLDYNPSDDYHWIYDNLLSRDDVKLLKSTYLDNPFLTDVQIQEIERLKHTDEDYWRVYGLGERGKSKATVFTFLEAEVPESAKLIAYGMDFGFTNDPTSLVAVYGEGDSLFAEELIYETNLTNRDISERLKALGIDRRAEIFADSAEPKSIEELYRMGWNIKPTKKGQDSINAGIDMLKRYKLHAKGHNLIKEMRNYKWVTDKNGRLLNKPVDAWNHCFTGDTLVTTINGSVPIKDIRANDLVLTSEGFKPVVHKFRNGMKQVSTYSIQFGTFMVILVCTDNHKVKTSTGWKEIRELKEGDVLFLHKSSTERHTTFITESDTLAREQRECTGWFGNTTTARFQKAITSTISMAIPLITKFQTLLSLMLKPILPTKAKKGLKKIQNGLENFMLRALNPLKTGMLRQKVLRGILRTVKGHGKKESTKKKNARFVGRSTKQDTEVYQSTVTKIVKQKHSEQEFVYDLMVDECHEYYANGILVHNCIDALRYATYNKLSKPNYGKYAVR